MTSNTATNDAATTSAKLDRAIALGERLRELRADPKLWRLSKPAWVAMAVELGDFSRGPADTRAHMLRFPALANEIETRATIWARNEQDRPGIWPGFGPHGDPVVYVELTTSGLSPAGASALAALRVTELRDASWWGSSSRLDPADGEAALAPHLRELATLDKQLAGTLLARQLTYRDGRAYLEHAGLELAMDAATAKAIATSIAELAGLRVPAAAAA